MSHIPKYRKSSNGYAFVEHKSIQTSTRRLYLGRYGSVESKRKYRQFLERLEFNQLNDIQEIKRGSFDHTVVELTMLYIRYAKEYGSSGFSVLFVSRCYQRVSDPLVVAESSGQQLVRFSESRELIL